MLRWDETPAFSSMRCTRAWVEINLDALAHNVRTIKALLAPETQLMAVVKADAYGHGALTVAKTVLHSGAAWLGVATVPEGIELRQAGINAPILVMGAVTAPEEVLAIARWRLQPTIVDPKQALIFSETLGSKTVSSETLSSETLSSEPFKSEILNSATLDVAPLPVTSMKTLPVHLMIDTGMSRLGFSWKRAVELARFVQQLPRLEAVSVYSHFATADSLNSATMWEQHRRFEAAIADLTQADLLPKKVHLANSAATLTDKSLHYNLVRVGLATYGLYPAPHLKSKVELKPVLAVKARITHLKHIEAGAGVSYGHRFIAPKAMKIAVVGIGYADGVPRLLSNRLKVAVTRTDNRQHLSDSKTYLVPQLGAITMDQMMLDVSDIPAIQEGDIVTLLGNVSSDQVLSDQILSDNLQAHPLSADQWAEMTDTISWEILCGFKNRLPRITLASSSETSTAGLSASTQPL